MRLVPAAIYQGVPGGSDPISLATAWLFVNFRTALPGYVDDADHNNAIQAAFWFLEGEGGGIDNAYVAAAKAGAGPDWAKDANGAYGVYVMNINVFDPGTFEGRLQDLLVVVPVPDGGLTVMLLGLAVGCLALISRRFGS